jgi:hypothetical protein
MTTYWQQKRTTGRIFNFTYLNSSTFTTKTCKSCNFFRIKLFSETLHVLFHYLIYHILLNLFQYLSWNVDTYACTVFNTFKDRLLKDSK